MNNTYFMFNYCLIPGVTHILNVSRDIENFFEKNFQYLRVDVLDRPDQNLLEYWQETYNFIKSCKEQGGKVSKAKGGIFLCNAQIPLTDSLESWAVIFVVFVETSCFLLSTLSLICIHFHRY